MATSPRHWGWHQLDPTYARRLVAEAAVRPGDLVLDVGAGHGALTRPLLDAGAHVIAVEAHPDRARHLREHVGRIIVVQADARDLRLPRRPFHVVANPPFDVTAALLRRLLQPGSRLLSAHLIVQEQAARRWSGTSAPAAGRWARHFHVSLGARVPRRAFSPTPRVDARVLRIRRRDAWR